MERIFLLTVIAFSAISMKAVVSTQQTYNHLRKFTADITVTSANGNSYTFKKNGEAVFTEFEMRKEDGTSEVFRYIARTSFPRRRILCV